MSRTKRSRPAEANHEAAESLAGDSPIVSPSSPAVADLDAMAEALRGYFVVQVVIDEDGHRRTNLYRSAGAAQRAVQRARERGRDVHVSLCQLMPVGVVVGLGGRG